MRYSLVAAALLTIVVAACDSKPKDEQGAMTPAGTDMVAPEAPAADTTEAANPNEGSSGGEQEAPATQAPATAPAPTAPATAPATTPTSTP